MTAPSVTPAETTHTYAQVVVPVDFSPLSWRVLTLADRMARAFGVPRRLLHVDTASPWLDEATGRLVLEGPPGGAKAHVDVVPARTPAAGILRALGENEPALLVMSSHGHTGAVELATGSTAEDVLRDWTGPALLAGPSYEVATVPFRRIVACVDPSTATWSEPLAADLRTWAQTFRIPIEVVAVFERMPGADFDEILTQNLRLEEAAAALSTDERLARVVRLNGERPGHEIARYADSVEGTLLALPTHAWPAPLRAVLGSTAMAVLRRTKSPVLVRRFG